MNLDALNLDALNLDALRPLIPLPMATKLIALVVVLVLICVGYYTVMWTPLQDAISAEKEQVEFQRVQLRKNQILASNIPKKREEYKNLQKQLKIALNMLPRQSQIPDLLEGVTWAGKDSGLTFSTFKPGNEAVKSIYAEVPVQLNVSGTFKQLLTFLKRVGEMPRIVDVKNLSVSSSGTDQVLKIKGQAVTYRFVDTAKK
ncbi:MAG: type 4a pilus biogenesis protein PilO [Ghiorsea sp.]